MTRVTTDRLTMASGQVKKIPKGMCGWNTRHTSIKQGSFIFIIVSQSTLWLIKDKEEQPMVVTSDFAVLSL